MKRFFLVLSCLVLGGFGTYVGSAVLQGQGTATSGGAAVLPREFTSYRDVVKKVLPGVVSIQALSNNSRGRLQGPDDRQMPRRGRLSDGLIKIDDDTPSPLGFGSGFLISSKGIVVTNNHVVAGADLAVVQLSDGRKIRSSKIITDPKTDLALVTLESKIPLPYLEFGDSGLMEIGDQVLAVGAPFGLTGTVTHGIISSRRRALDMNMYEDFLQTDAAINPGNSGGPLISLEGKVIGVNSAIKSKTGGFQGIGLAISSNLAKVVVDQLLKDGVVRRGYLGVRIRDVDEEAAKEMSLKESKGVLVTGLFPGTPGTKAGLKRGDVILSVGGKTVADGRALQLAVAALPLGKPTELLIIRDGEQKTMNVVIEEQPKAYGNTREQTVPQIPRNAITVTKAGITVTDLTDELSEALGYPVTVKGALITRVDRGSVAALAGLENLMVIVSVNKKAANTAKAIKDAITAGSLKKGILVQARTPRSGPRNFVLKDDEE